MPSRRYPAEAVGARMSSREDCGRGDTMSSSCAPTRNAIRFLRTTMASPCPAFPRSRRPFHFCATTSATRRLYERLSRHLVERHQERKDRSHPRAACLDRSAIGDGGTTCRHPIGVHRARLLAGVLLGRRARRSRRGRCLPRLLSCGDDAMSAAAHRTCMARHVAHDSVHARQPAAQAGEPRGRGRHRGGQWLCG